MKQIIPFVFFGLVSSSLYNSSCKKTGSAGSNSPEKDATLTGFDQRGCPCCGGLMITFNGETKPYIAPFFLVENDAASLGIEATASFPIAVRVNYSLMEKCGGSYIKIEKLVKK